MHFSFSATLYLENSWLVGQIEETLGWCASIHCIQGSLESQVFKSEIFGTLPIFNNLVKEQNGLKYGTRGGGTCISIQFYTGYV